MSLKNFNLKKIEEKINRVSAVANPKDSKYPLTLTIDVYPVRISNLNIFHPDFEKYKNLILQGKSFKLLKTIEVKGDYATKGNTGVKTLRLKIDKSNWPDEWYFPDQEIERRIFLQNFRLSNLSMLTSYDEGGEKYNDIFPPSPKTPVTIEFKNEEDDFDPEEETEVEEESEEEETNKESPGTLEDVFDMLDVLQDSAFEEEEYEIARNLNLAVRQLAREVFETRKKR